MAARNRFRVGALSASAVSPALARLIAELSGARELARRIDSLIVTDPATGAGDLLAAVAHVLGPDCTPMFTGAEADPVLARLVRRRLTVHDVPIADVDIRVGAELPDESGDPDVVVTQIPYRPGEDRDAVAVLDSVGDAAVRMTAGRFAVVLGPAAALADDLPPFSAAARARADLLKGDMVEAIVRLPGGLVPFRPGYETALWVLTQARHSRWRGRVLLADVSDRPLTADVVRDLAEDVITWRRDGYVPSAHRRAFGVQVEISSLVDPPRPLMAGRRLGGQREQKADANERVSLITQYGADLDRFGATATADRGHVGTEALAAADRQPATEAIGALVRQGRLVMRKGTRLAPADVGGSGKHVVLGAEEVLGFRRPGERRVDLEVFANRYPNARLTEPGDVLVTMNPRPGVMIDHEGYAIAEYPVRILRIPGTTPPSFLLSLLLPLLFFLPSFSYSSFSSFLSLCFPFLRIFFLHSLTHDIFFFLLPQPVPSLFVAGVVAPFFRFSRGCALAALASARGRLCARPACLPRDAVRRSGAARGSRSSRVARSLGPPAGSSRTAGSRWTSRPRRPGRGPRRCRAPGPRPGAGPSRPCSSRRGRSCRRSRSQPPAGPHRPGCARLRAPGRARRR